MLELSNVKKKMSDDEDLSDDELTEEGEEGEEADEVTEEPSEPGMDEEMMDEEEAEGEERYNY